MIRKPPIDFGIPRNISRTLLFVIPIKVSIIKMNITNTRNLITYKIDNIFKNSSKV